MHPPGLGLRRDRYRDTDPDAAMSPDRACLLARLVATAASRRSADFDTFSALVAARCSADELAELGQLLPVLAGYPVFVAGLGALRRFERDGETPPLQLSGAHVESLAQRARLAAIQRSLDHRETEPFVWLGRPSWATSAPAPLAS